MNTATHPANTSLQPHLAALRRSLVPWEVEVMVQDRQLVFKTRSKQFSIYVNSERYPSTDQPILPLDYLVTRPEKIAGLVLSKLHLNTTLHARKCVFRKADKKIAAAFLDTYHFLNATNAAVNYGLYHQEELVALASFSKGRRMNRLAAHERSYEMIRFCCKRGVTVAGGLTRLVRNFCMEKKAAEVMTYIDKQFSDGRSFARSGFVKIGESLPVQFMVNRNTFERTPLKEGLSVDPALYYLVSNAGNIKMIYRHVV